MEDIELNDHKTNAAKFRGYSCRAEIAYLHSVGEQTSHLTCCALPPDAVRKVFQRYSGNHGAVFGRETASFVYRRNGQ